MDFQKTKEARRGAPGQQEESTDCPLEAYGGSGHAKESPKNDSLDRCDATDCPDAADARQRSIDRVVYREHAPQSPSPIVLATGSPSSSSSKSLEIPTAVGLRCEDHRLLLTAKRYPPVTKSTLSELDLPCIMSNINLRMDANFDRDLHFKPDLDGEKGRRKRKEAADYWEAMAVEISIYAFYSSPAAVGPADNAQNDQRQAFEPRLPAMFETLQDVLKTLVPERDHPSVMQNLEVSLLMQQIQKGVLDMVRVATWLAGLLKTHCAPMRDEWADRMVEQIRSGSQSQNPMEIVSGLQTLFAILEAMKLDVANHQIRAFRVLLIEDTVPFLQEYFRGKIERDNFRVESSRRWYLEAQEREVRPMDKPAQTDGLWPISVLFRGITDLLLQFHTPEAFPETFVFDSERLWQLRTCLQNLINLDICWFIFESYIHTQKRYLSAPAQTYATFRSRIGSLMEENEDCTRGSPQWVKNVRCMALEIARFVYAACCNDGTVSDEVLASIESALEWHLSNESNLFQYFQSSLREKLLAATFATAKKYLLMSPLAICESQRNFPPTTSMGHQQHYDVERISMRLAHMGVLHWRVWAPILYVRVSVSPTDVATIPSNEVYDVARSATF
ncbi:TCP11 family protein [Aspergillus saccharolyticus JOP 1030-1]|uniref:Camp-mediated signaling protein Sok1 n=1 Tax=Aspergillus saccharolyticus JOP 1030-1 TaxID=1450539 RepID=A0A318ZLZ9_9EURO|nr:camp-mediated signaling protein Sok1 [Aspergillus saccharolyticus JOP 1030-1]PYH47474.1 camp-mediated signaling protein Sok1 [Aspergillus saccharolyticus JOP 1030-1]